MFSFWNGRHAAGESLEYVKVLEFSLIIWDLSVIFSFYILYLNLY